MRCSKKVSASNSYCKEKVAEQETPQHTRPTMLTPEQMAEEDKIRLFRFRFGEDLKRFL